MFEETKPLTADLWYELAHHDSHLQQSPCACCSTQFSQLNEVMATTSETLAQPQHWAAKRPPLPAISTRVQLFINARIHVMDDGFREADSLAIGDGRILATGDVQSLQQSHPDAELIDCGGRTILPGFIEPHMHFLPIATIGQFADVGPFTCPTVNDALEKLKALSHQADSNDWIVARQFDPSLQDGGEKLDRHMLDGVSTDKAILVYNASLHFAYCNSKALEIAGITADTRDETGSSFGRDPDGSPNGVLQGGRCMGLVAKHNPNLANYDLAENCLAVCERANQLGITTFCDQATGMSRGIKEIEIYQALADSGRMSARLRYSLSYALQDRWDATDIKCGDGNEMVRAVAWKIVSDGSNQGFSGLQRAPYLNSNDTGVAYVEKDALREMVLDRTRRGWSLAIHANGDKAIDNTLDAYEAAFDAGQLTRPPYRIEHCSILHDDQIERIARMGLSPSFLIGHVHYWGHAMRDRVFGPTKAALLDRTAACEAKGIRWTLHSDEPVTNMGALRCIENAVTRNLWKEPGNQLAPDECIDARTAVRAMTRDAAWQCHSDHEIGTLEPGKFADFVILDADPMTVPADTIGQIKVLQTWMGGRKVYEAT